MKWYEIGCSLMQLVLPFGLTRTRTAKELSLSRASSYTWIVCLLPKPGQNCHDVSHWRYGVSRYLVIFMTFWTFCLMFQWTASKLIPINALIKWQDIDVTFWRLAWPHVWPDLPNGKVRDAGDSILSRWGALKDLEFFVLHHSGMKCARSAAAVTECWHGFGMFWHPEIKDERFRAALVKWQRKCGTSLSAVKRVACDACETSWTNSARQAVICSCRVHISVQHVP
jgi:hypothetical protein